MNRRRMMTGTKAEPLAVFEYGKAALSAGTFSGNGISFENGYMVVRPRNNKNGYINIAGINFSRYEKLKIECFANIANFDENKELHFCGYGKTENYEKEDYISFQYAPSYSKVLEFDIGKIKNETFIKATADHIGTAYMAITNIWLE